MVVGGGISGIQSSLDLAEAGYYVYLVESSPAIGGTMPMLDKTFPTNDCSMCILSPKLVECGRHLNIKIITQAEIKDIEGEAGDFKVKIFQRKRSVDLDKCTGCGDCARACPVELPDEFNAGMGKRKAIYKLYPQATPSAFAIEKRGTPPCRDACPAGVNAQGYVQLIRLGKYKEAWEVIYRDNPFPAICGRVCTNPCQDACYRGKIDSPVQIRELKRLVTDIVYREPEEIPLPEITGSKEEKVAVIGAGPAGLSCAYQLVKKGYRVTVFEAHSEPGGMMRLCIPSYRLPKEWVDLEVDLIKRLGVEIKTNSALGRDFTIKGLLEEGYRAVFLGLGAHGKVRLGIPGEDLAIHGVDFLQQVDSASVSGRRVIVVGGGNVAMDVARTSVRLGAAQVNLVCLEAEEEMPASDEEIRCAREEGVMMQNSLGIRAVLGGQGNVTGITTIKVDSVFDAQGRFNPTYIEGTEADLEGDIVFLAVGQRTDLSGVEEFSKERWLPADRETAVSTVPGVFAGGDAVTGPASIVEAVGAGKRAAESIAAYLNGEEAVFTKKEVAPPRFEPGEVDFKPPVEAAVLRTEVRKNNFQEVDLGLTEEEAREEADRCLNCGVCSECLECERACLRKAVNHNAEDTELEIEVGAVILSPGFKIYDAKNLDYYGYGVYPNVITSMELERVLSASGPYQGHLVRPSDGREPRKMAFIQCVGSRNVKIERDYCSSACCMYTIKEAVIAKEHSHEPLETTVFYMDMRTHGKDFERYYDRAKNEYGVRFERSRIYAVEETGDDGALKIKYAREHGVLDEETFDLVVLAIGLNPPQDAGGLAAAAHVELDKYGFCKSDELVPGRTSREGIFVSGVFKGPKDIPETVMEASAACGYAAQLLGDVRGTLTRAREFPPERDVSGEEPRIGAFICNCGINIGGIADVPKIVEYARTLPNVVWADDNLFTCSQDSIEKIKDAIKEHNLNRVIVASCTPRTHRPLFQETVREAGLNRQLFEMVNIRDQCTWVHMHQPQEATEKAIDLVRMIVAKAALLDPVSQVSVGVTKAALVVGGGVSGLTCALVLAGQGYETHIVEKEDELGGMARRFKWGLKGSDVQAHLAGLIDEVESHPLINVHTGSEIEGVSGYIGNYQTRLTSGVGIDHGVAIIASGAKEYKPQEYSYGQDDRVLTQLELEEAIFNDDPRVKTAQNVVFIQCVGSREENRMYCSRICCTKSVKLALKIKEANPQANIYILYRDMRTYSFYEEYYQQAREQGIVFIRFDAASKPVVETENGRLTVGVTDHILGTPLSIEADIVGLAPAILALDTNKKTSQFFKIPVNQDGFFLEAHMKLRPVDFATEGIFMAGTSHGPKNLEECIAQAKAAAGRASTILSKDILESHGVVARVQTEKCQACLTCVRLCPYGAPRIKNNKAEIEAVICQGCGTCAGECPNKAIQLQGYKDSMLMAMSEGLFAEVN